MEKGAVSKTGYNRASGSRETGEQQNRSRQINSEKRKSNESDGSDAKKKPKISFGFNKPISSLSPTTKTSLSPVLAKEAVSNLKTVKPISKDVVKPSAAFAKAFNDDDDEEVEMPPEARMRMRNVGRETPTSCGPNSFGKTKRGFCDARTGGAYSSKLPKAPK